MSTTRHLVASAALALGLLAAPAAAGAATGLTTPRPTPPPPVGADDLAVPLPDLTVEAFDGVEGDGAMAGRLTLSAPLTVDVPVVVHPLLLGIDQWDFGCLDPGDGSCGSYLGLAIPAGTTQVDFEVSVWTDDGAEPAERYGFEALVHEEGLVDVGPPAEAILYDGSGLELGIVDDHPEAVEGDPGSDGTLDVVVEANQAMPVPVTFRAYSVIMGGYNGGLPHVDYEPIDVIVELPAGETTTTVSVPLIGDQLDESPYEILGVNIADPSHGEVAFDGGGSIPRILDDDAPVVTWERPGSYQSPSRSARSAALTA